MYPKNTADVEYPDAGKHNGTRGDGRNLVQEWLDRNKDNVKASSCCTCPLLVVILPITGIKAAAALPFTRVLSNSQKGRYVWNKKQLLSLNPTAVDYLLGTSSSSSH